MRSNTDADLEAALVGGRRQQGAMHVEVRGAALPLREGQAARWARRRAVLLGVGCRRVEPVDLDLRGGCGCGQTS